MPDGGTVRREPLAVGGPGREVAADVDLAAVASEDLFVRGEDGHLAARDDLDLETLQQGDVTPEPGEGAVAVAPLFGEVDAEPEEQASFREIHGYLHSVKMSERC